MSFTLIYESYGLLLQFLILFWISGWLTYCLAFDKFRNDPEVNSEITCYKSSIENTLETIVFSVICGLIPTSFGLIILAQIHFLQLRYLFVGLAIYTTITLVFLLRSKRLKPCFLSYPWKFQFHWSDIYLLLILALGVFTFSKPAEYVTTQRDPGKYANIAIQLAQTKGLNFQEPDIQNYGLDKQKLFLSTPIDQDLYSEVFPGFRLVNLDEGKLVPQFLHLFPLWLSLAFKLCKFEGLFALNIILSLLSLLILVQIAIYLFQSKMIGLLSATLLSLNLSQIWLARSPFSEVLAQVFILSSICLLGLSVEKKRKGLGFLAGLILGMTLLVRIDSFLILPAVLIFCLFWRSKQRSSFSFLGRPFLFGLIISTTYSLSHLIIFAYPYLLSILGNLQKLFFDSFDTTWVILLLLILAISTLTYKGMTGKLRSLFTKEGSTIYNSFQDTSCINFMKRDKEVMLVVCIFLTLIFAYGYFLRPQLASGDDILPLPKPYQGLIRFYDDLNLIRLSWYLSPLGLFLSYVGILLAIWKFLKTQQITLLLFLLVLGVFGLFYLYKSQAFPDNYWVIRRYGQITIPGLILLSIFSIQQLYQLRPRRKINFFLFRFASVFLFSSVLVWQIHAASPFLNKSELPRTLKQIELLASRTEKADIVVFEYGIAQQFFLGPLRTLFGQSVFPLAHLKPDAQTFEKVITRWLDTGKQINLISSDEHTSISAPTIEFKPKERFQFSSEMIEQTYERLPQKMKSLNYTLQIYQVQSRKKEIQKPKSATHKPLNFNFGYASTGFHPIESSLSRWSKGSASIELPEIQESHEAVLMVRLAGSMLKDNQQFPVEINLNDCFVGSIYLVPTLKTYKMIIPGSCLAQNTRNQLHFLSDQFNPSENRELEDNRKLGFMLNCAKIRTLEPVGIANPYYLDIGSECAEVNGFHGKENEQYRWTEASANLILPMPLKSNQKHRLGVRAVKASPEPHFRQFLTVRMDNVELGTKELIGSGDNFEEYWFDIPKEVASKTSPVISFLIDPIWNPSLIGVSSDYRNLGCAIDWIRIESDE